MESRPPLRGFNHNIRYRDRTYHVQTEDSGVDNPHLFTHIYQGGVIIASAKFDYSDLVSDPGHPPKIRRTMQEQHKRLMKQLRRGEFDEKIVAVLGAVGPAPEPARAEAPAPPQPARAEPPVPPQPTSAEPPATPQPTPAEPPAAPPKPAVAAPVPEDDGLTVPIPVKPPAAPPREAPARRSVPAFAAPRPASARVQVKRPSVESPAVVTPPQPLPAVADARSPDGMPQVVASKPEMPARGEVPSAEVLIDRPPAEWTEAPPSARARPAIGTPARTGPPPPRGPAQPPRVPVPPLAVGGPGQRPASGLGQLASRGHEERVSVFDSPLPKQAPQTPSKSRPPGVYPVSGRLPLRPPHPDPTARERATRVASAPSTPQRYTAPASRRPTAARGARSRPATGSYLIPEGVGPVAEVARGTGVGHPRVKQTTMQRVPRHSDPRVQVSGRPVRPQAQQGLQRPSERVPVVARPAIILDGRKPKRAAASSRPDESNPQTPRNPRTMPNLFGSDLISERSLDEVILGYLAEEEGGSEE